ncbi:helix-turn-helix domain-containing protein [Actinosynnema sp. NPDC059335]|uniref:helix-turn-helix domain-containing protein n=1 Tax=Actinosynnema sp. NPDC059335 TaxID=3346804 RepID=UPI00366D2332
MTTDKSAGAPWWDFVQRQLDDRGMTTADLTKATGIDKSRFTQWRQGKRASLDSARLIAKAFGMSPLEVMVEARLLTAQEVNLDRVSPDPAQLTNQQLLAELDRRLKRLD